MANISVIILIVACVLAALAGLASLGALLAPAGWRPNTVKRDN